MNENLISIQIFVQQYPNGNVDHSMYSIIYFIPSLYLPGNFIMV